MSGVLLLLQHSLCFQRNFLVKELNNHLRDDLVSTGQLMGWCCCCCGVRRLRSEGVGGGGGGMSVAWRRRRRNVGGLLLLSEWFLEDFCHFNVLETTTVDYIKWTTGSFWRGLLVPVSFWPMELLIWLIMQYCLLTLSWTTDLPNIFKTSDEIFGPYGYFSFQFGLNWPFRFYGHIFHSHILPWAFQNL